MNRPQVSPISQPQPLLHSVAAVAAAAAAAAASRRARSTPPLLNVSGEAQLLCNYTSYLCRREKVPGHDFCARHVLEDKAGPYKQCNFQYRTHRRCPRPAPKADRKDGYCVEHSRKAMMARQKTIRKRATSDFTHRCLEDLTHYKRVKKTEIKTEVSSGSQTPTNNATTTNGLVGSSPNNELRDLEEDINPFPVVNHITTIPSPPPTRAFDVGSDVDTDEDSATVESAWKGDGDSDAESVDSEMENPLKHAGAYSAEEVIRIMRDKLIRLQKLYIDQFQRLQYLLREEKRHYRVALRKEHETELMSIQRQPKETNEERVAYEQVRAMNHYNRPSGTDAVLHANLMERRVRLSEASSSTIAPVVPGGHGKASVAATASTLPKCSFNITSSMKCGETCVPLTKFCQKHMLNDPNQVLFRLCGFVAPSCEDDHQTDDDPCETPIPDLFESSSCVYHTPIQMPFAGTAMPAAGALEVTEQQVQLPLNMLNPMSTVEVRRNHTLMQEEPSQDRQQQQQAKEVLQQ